MKNERRCTKVRSGRLPGPLGTGAPLQGCQVQGSGRTGGSAAPQLPGLPWQKEEKVSKVNWT